MEQILGVDVRPIVVAEPVMDVPAIVMTGPVSAAKTSATSKSKTGATKRSTPKRKQSTRAVQAVAPAKRTRDGSVGRETFEQVEALLKQGKNKTEAFNQIAGDTGRNSGTVAANYYRVARASGASKPRQRRGKASTATSSRGRRNGAQSVQNRRSATAGNSVDQIATQLVASVQALTEAVKAQDAQIREVRGRLDGIRSLLG